MSDASGTGSVSDSVGDGYVDTWTKGPKSEVEHLNKMVGQGNNHEKRISDLEGGGDGKKTMFILDVCFNGAPIQIALDALIVTV